MLSVTALLKASAHTPSLETWCPLESQCCCRGNSEERLYPYSNITLHYFPCLCAVSVNAPLHSSSLVNCHTQQPLRCHKICRGVHHVEVLLTQHSSFPEVPVH